MARIIHHREDTLHIGIVRAWSFCYGKYAHHFGIETPEEWRLLLHHSPNGGKRSAIEAARFKAMGTRKGFPDLILALPWNGYHGAFFELKSEKGRLSKEQEVYLALLKKQGYKTFVTRSYEDFDKQLKEYFNFLSYGTSKNSN